MNLLVLTWLQSQIYALAIARREARRNWEKKYRALDRVKVANRARWADNREQNKTARGTKEAREKAAITHRKWRKKNLEKRAADMREWRSQPKNKIASNLRSRIANALKGRTKFFNLKEVVGVELEDLISWLQIQFSPGMAWENYGLWEVDHVRPCDSFDLSQPENQKACFHFSNLQPLWKTPNRVKGNRYELR